MRITTLEEYEEFMNKQKECVSYSMGEIQILFRGHALDSYELLPSISRNCQDVNKILQFERFLYCGLISHIVGGKIGSVRLNLPRRYGCYLYNWFILFQARHLEVPSRLLDWSMNELTALYFAVCDKQYFGQDGHVWIYPSFKNPMIVNSFTQNQINRIQEKYLHLSAGESDKKKLNEINPFDPKKITLLHNSYILDEWEKQIGERRRALQAGKFVVKPNNEILIPLNKSFTGQWMQKVIVDGNSKQAILCALLKKYNFDTDRILPNIPPDTKQIIDNVILSAKSKLTSNYFLKIYYRFQCFICILIHKIRLITNGSGN